MRLKKLSVHKDILGKEPPQQYAARRFSNKASETVGHSVTSAAPFYLTSRDGKSMEYATKEVFRKSKGAVDLKSIAHAAAPDEYNTFGYHNILNMGLGDTVSAYTDAPSTDWVQSDNTYREEVRSARGRLLSAYNFKLPARYVDTAALQLGRPELSKVKAKLQLFETGGLLRQTFLSRSNIDLEASTKSTGGGLRVQQLKSLTKLRRQSIGEVYAAWTGRENFGTVLKKPGQAVGSLEKFYTEGRKSMLENSDDLLPKRRALINFIALDSQLDSTEELNSQFLAEVRGSRIAEELFPTRVMRHVEEGVGVLRGRIAQLDQTVTTLRLQLDSQSPVPPKLAYRKLNQASSERFINRAD